MGGFTTGWVYNLKDANAPTAAGRLVAAALAFPVIATLAILLRFYARARNSTRNFRLDDIAALWSLVFCIVYSGIAIYQTRWGQALDPKFFPAQNIVPFSKVQYSGGPVYCFALLGFKISLLAAYLRIAGLVKRSRMIIHGVMVLVTINQIAFTCALSFACRPISKQWDLTVSGSCINQLASYYGLAGTSLGLDIIIIALPFPTLIKLQMHWKKKAAVGCMLALGLFVTVIQIIRIFTISKLVSYTNSYSIVVWSIVEINLGVVICSIPSYAPLVRFARDKVFSSMKAASGAQSSGTKMQTWRKSIIGNQESGHGPSETDSVEKGTIKATTVWSVEAERASLYKDNKQPPTETV